jgi:spermidine synthase
MIMSKNTPDASFTTLHTYETKSTITLQFNHDALQSTMRKSDPFALEFEYTQVMMAFMVLYETLPHILLIGLGGGSLSKFCYKYLPQSKITTVEINPEVIAHRQTFCIPPNSQRFKIIEADGAEYLQQKNAICNAILLDAYDGQGIPPALASEAFYQDCYQALANEGVLVVNLWRKDANFRRNLDRIHRCFDKKTITVRCQSGNEIIFAFKNPQLPDFDEAWKKALWYQTQTKINFPQFLEDMVLSLKNTWFYTGQST